MIRWVGGLWDTSEERESKKLWAERGFCHRGRDRRVKWFPLSADVFYLQPHGVPDPAAGEFPELHNALPHQWTFNSGANHRSFPFFLPTKSFNTTVVGMRIHYVWTLS